MLILLYLLTFQVECYKGGEVLTTKPSTQNLSSSAFREFKNISSGFGRLAGIRIPSARLTIDKHLVLTPQLLVLAPARAGVRRKRVQLVELVQLVRSGLLLRCMVMVVHHQTLGFVHRYAISLQDYSRQFPIDRHHDARAAEAQHTTRLLTRTAGRFFRVPTARVQLGSVPHSDSEGRLAFIVCDLSSIVPETFLLKIPSTKIKRREFQMAWVQRNLEKKFGVITISIITISQLIELVQLHLKL